MRPPIKAALKWLRASQPFNWIATSAVRAALRATHVHSELVVASASNGNRARAAAQRADHVSVVEGGRLDFKRDLLAGLERR